MISMSMICQITEAAHLLDAAQEQGFIVYFLCFLLVTLSGIVMFLYKRVESRTDMIIQLYKDQSKNEQQFKELTQMIRDRNMEALKELVATMEAERRMSPRISEGRYKQ